MKLSVSNIAWEKEEMDDHLRLLRDLGCEGVELAPNSLWPEPAQAPAGEAAALARRIRGLGLEVVGFHALLFTRPDLRLFEAADGVRRTADYLKRLAGLCAEMGGRVLVFGSPKNRAVGDKDRADCLARAVEGFREVAEAAAPLGVVLCIEPLPPAETDFIRSSDEGMDLARRVDHPGFGLHLDGRAMSEMGEDAAAVLGRYGKDLRHFHVGDPGLSPPGSTGKIDHAKIGRALRAAGYNGYVSIEMRRGFGPSREAVRRGVEHVKRCYWEADA